MIPIHYLYHLWRAVWCTFPGKIILIDKLPLFVVAGRRFRSGIRTTGPSDNFRDYGSSNTHAHTGTILSIYLSLSVLRAQFQTTTFLLILVLFVTIGAPSSVAHVQQTPSEMVAICGCQGEVGVIDSVHWVPAPLKAGEFR